jgi:hypothetical protein
MLLAAGGYSSNEELVDALLTGTHMSLVSDGSLWTHFRGHRYVDSGEHSLSQATVGTTWSVVRVTLPWPSGHI